MTLQAERSLLARFVWQVSIVGNYSEALPEFRSVGQHRFKFIPNGSLFAADESCYATLGHLVRPRRLLEDFVTTPGDVLVAWFIALRPRPNSIWIVLEKYDTLVEVTLIKFIGEWLDWWQVEIASESCATHNFTSGGCSGFRRTSRSFTYETPAVM